MALAAASPDLLARASCSSSSRGSAPPPTTRKDRSSRPTSAADAGRAGCRCSRSAATSATALGAFATTAARRRARAARRAAARGPVPRRRGRPARAARRTCSASCPTRGRAAVAGAATTAARSRLLLAVIAFRSLAWFGLRHVRPALGGLARPLEVVREPPARADAPRRGVGTLAAGPIADRIGLRTVLVLAQPRDRPLMLVFVLVGGVPEPSRSPSSAPSVIGTFGITMVMAQEYLPRRIGDGLRAVDRLLDRPRRGRGGRSLGAVADSIDLRTALYVARPRPCGRSCSRCSSRDARAAAARARGRGAVR